MAIGCNLRAPGVVVLVLLSGCRADQGGALALRARAERDPQTAWRLVEEGLALVEQGSYAQAESRFRAAVEADAYHGPARCNLGVLLLKRGKLYEAGHELQFACKLMPKAAAPRCNLGILFDAAGNYGEAEQEMRAALGNAPDDIEIIGQLARLHVRQGKCTAETKGWLQTIASKDDEPAWRDWARRELNRKGSEQRQQEIER